LQHFKLAFFPGSTLPGTVQSDWPCVQNCALLYVFTNKSMFIDLGLLM